MQSTNFEFLRPENETLANLAGLAEAVIHIDAGSALTRLRGFAEEVTKAIYKEERLTRIPQAQFYDLLKNSVFEGCVSKSLLYQIDSLRIQGNKTAHGAEGDLRNAQIAMGTAHQLAMYLAIKYYSKKKTDIPAYKDLEDPRQELKQLKKSVNKYASELNEKSKELEGVIEQLDKERAEKAEEIPEPAKQDAEAKKQQSQQVADSLEWNEAKTRANLIDVMLAQAGWDTTNPDQVGIEFPVTYEDGSKGRADYILWGDNEQPLAVLEAKRSSEENLQKGREQARLYADALEHMGYQRPVIFYSNGYENFIWDDVQYNTYRPIYGAYTKDSLDYLIYQRQYREPDLEQHNPKLEIANRGYQIEAIKSVAHKFQQQRRKTLIVQATGTGKTRVAIAIAELLLRCGWGKRILFLCDRKELRTQADDAFKEYLPGEPRCVVGESSKINQDARLFVATYPAMMGRFAQLDVGFFDLIIADESHRSIYNKYRDLFDYFDSLQLGLTATPVKYIARNTFDIFECEDTDPTFSFSLEEAINHEPPYLTPFKVKDLTTEFTRDGIHYDQLTEDQQKQLEEDLGEEEAKNTTIKGKDIGRKIFSEKTDKIILENLMNNGIKDATGSLVGKTIIFAQRQDHAAELERIFCKLYPQYGTKVCKVIHGEIANAEKLIKDFKKPDNDFRIAISVDMMDTGIDVPEVVNLVFARPVRSWVKFWQMIGRGTRLCENLFGPGKDKTEFRIYDHYENFKYFEEEYEEVEQQGGKSLLQHVFESRLALVESALKASHAKAFDAAAALIKQDINGLPETSIQVKRELRTVHQLQQTDMLDTMQAPTINTLYKTVAPLMGARVLKDKYAIAFDRLVSEIETCLVNKASCFEEGQQQLLAELETLAVNIPAVRKKDAVLEEVRSAEFWQNATIEKLEYARTELRGIMKYRRKGGSIKYTPGTSTQDGEVRETERKVSLGDGSEALLYRRRVKAVLDDMINSNPVLQKIHKGDAIEVGELKTLTSTILTTHPGVNLEVLNEFYGRAADELDVTVREIIGMDAEAVEKHFTEFLHNHPKLTAQQVRFMNLLKKYISENGGIHPDKLSEAPFTSVSDLGVDGVFEQSDVKELFTVLEPFLRKDEEIATQKEKH